MLCSLKHNLTARFVNTSKFLRDGLFRGKQGRCTLLITRRLQGAQLLSCGMDTLGLEKGRLTQASESQ
jgi:hypothetical protein